MLSWHVVAKKSSTASELATSPASSSTGQTFTTPGLPAFCRTSCA